MFIFVLLSNSKEFKQNNQSNKYASYSGWNYDYNSIYSFFVSIIIIRLIIIAVVFVIIIIWRIIRLILLLHFYGDDIARFITIWIFYFIFNIICSDFIFIKRCIHRYIVWIWFYLIVFIIKYRYKFI